MLMKVKRLTKTYHGQKVLSDLSFAVAKGELISLVGPSGCGKSTLLRCLAGLSSGTSGTIELNGEDITNRSTEKRPIVMMFQQPLLFPHLTILQNVTYGLKYQKPKVKKSERIERGLGILEKVEIASLAHRYPNEISGGQQQRVSLARALILNPALLLLDEPFSSLDPPLRTSLRKWVREFLKKEGVTALFVTHDREEAMVIGDRIAVMKDGTFQQFATPEEVYSQPENATVAGLFSEGLYNNRKFIQANKLKLTTVNKLLPADNERLSAVVEHKVMKYGYPFFRVSIPSIKQTVVIQSNQSFQENEAVDVYYKISDVSLITNL
ncbi:ABC transporter ATP-binding protein [Anaerobacillus alkalilacustris]|nr:ABC transporter ATP-binding protein [Anaerobacillus alkalilacustris]